MPFRHRLRVRFAETDAMGVVHHAAYLLYLEAARVEYLRAIGHPYLEFGPTASTSPCSRWRCSTCRPCASTTKSTSTSLLAAVTRATFQIAYLLTVDDSHRQPPP